MKRTSYIIIAAIIVGAAGFLLASRMYSGSPLNNEFPEFYRAGFLRRTEQLEKLQTIQTSIQNLQSAGICGFNFKNRVSQTSTDPVLALNCITNQWLYVREGIPALSVTRFAILKRDSGMIVVTPAEKGNNTLEEYAVAIPQAVEGLIQAWPGILKAEQDRQSEAAASAVHQQQKQKDVEDSFK
jgi:hypothetical protein